MSKIKLEDIQTVLKEENWKVLTVPGIAGQLQKRQHVVGIPGEKKGTKEIFNVVTENFPKLIPDTKQIQEAQSAPSKINGYLTPYQKKKKNYTQAYNFQTTKKQK